MSDGPEWFAPKRYGYGAGLPISWQGWMVTIAYLAIVIGIVVIIDGENALPLLAAVIPVSVAFILIIARTTRGGWRWRWGEKE